MGAVSTRGSLLGRLAQEDDSAAAWEEFVRIDSPQVLRWCRAHGLQDSDAADVCQDELVRFWKQAASFQYDPNRRSRGYLKRRLCYVGVTRARKRLMLSLALTRMKWGKAKPSKPSRFLYELTGQAEKLVEGPAEPRDKVGAKPRKRR